MQGENRNKVNNSIGRNGSQIIEAMHNKNQNKGVKRIKHYQRVMSCYQKMKSGSMFESAHIVDVCKKKAYDSDETGVKHQRLLYSC